MQHRGIGYKIVVGLVLTYLLFTIIVEVVRREQLPVAAVKVTLRDSSEVRFVTPRLVKKSIQDSILNGKNELQEVNLEEIETFLEKNLYLSDVVVSSNMEGEIDIALSQRRPLFRVVSQRGYDFYVDSTLRVLKPVMGYYPNITLLTGDIVFGFQTDFFGDLDEKKENFDIENLNKLSNFVGNINNDSYLKDLISQIYLRSTSRGDIEVEIIPSVGRALVLFGELDSIEEKLSKLSLFYRKAYSYAGLDSVKVVDVRFNGQVLTK